jgi:hypothetical protein
MEPAGYFDAMGSLRVPAQRLALEQPYSNAIGGGMQKIMPTAMQWISGDPPGQLSLGAK